MSAKFLVPLFDVLDLWYRLVKLLSLFLAPIVDSFLLLLTQLIVNLFSNLEFEGDGDVRAGTVRRMNGGVVLVHRHIGLLLFFPLFDNLLAETRIPGVRTVSL